jgi:hypothetical protein
MKFRNFRKSFTISYLIGIFPIIYLYNQNSAILNLSSLLLPLVILLVISTCMSIIFSIIYKNSPINSWLSSSISILFFTLYGLVYDHLLEINVFQVDHATLIPFYLFIFIVLVRFVTRRIIVKSEIIYNALIFILSGLIVFNIASVIPAESRKYNNLHNTSVVVNPLTNNEKLNQIRPDVYFIVLDESVGFNAIRDYWKYDKIQEFEKFLHNKGFFIFNNSKSKTTDTLIEIASRLNFEDYSANSSNSPQELFLKISENRTMQLFKKYGYSTIVFDQVRAENGYPTKTPIIADYNFESPKVSSRNWSFDDFFMMVFDRTLLRPFCDTLRVFDPAITQHRNDVNYFFGKIASLEEIKSPKFIYAHILLTHVPLVFDENGGYLDLKYYYNWEYYLDSYKLELKKVTQLVTSLLLNTNHDNPPIIIIQSDHGFRNIDSGHVGSAILPNYPEEDKYSIINTIYFPGYDYSKLPDNLDPINTFPIIFNYYFNENIPLH